MPWFRVSLGYSKLSFKNGIQESVAFLLRECISKYMLMSCLFYESLKEELITIWRRFPLRQHLWARGKGQTQQTVHKAQFKQKTKDRPCPFCSVWHDISIKYKFYAFPLYIVFIQISSSEHLEKWFLYSVYRKRKNLCKIKKKNNQTTNNWVFFQICL